MTWLVLATLTALFIALHALPFLPGARGRAVAVAGGENRYKLAYTVLSLIALFGAFAAAGRAPVVVLWTPGEAVRWAALVVTLPAFVLLAAAYVGGTGTRLARHPMLSGIGLWGLAHVASVGTLAHLVIFGALTAYAPPAMIASDRRLARRDAPRFETVRHETSLVPFWSLLRGGSREGLRWGPSLAVGLGAWAAFLLAHRWLFGVSPLPLTLR